MQAKDKQRTFFDSLDIPTYQAERRKKTLWFGLAIIAVVAISAMLWVAWSLAAKENDFQNNLSKRLDLMTESQVQVIDNLVATVVDQANRVINSELFRLYAAEVHLIQDDVSLLVTGPLTGAHEGKDEVAHLSAQLPMMQSVLLEFTRISGYIGGRIVNRNGTVFIATDASTSPLRHDQNEVVEEVLRTQVPQFGPLRDTEQGLVLETFLPIFPPEASGLDNVPVAVLLLTKSVQEQLKALGSNRLLEQGERTRLLQPGAQGYQEVVPWIPGQLLDLKEPPFLQQTDVLPFAVRTSVDGEGKVYSMGKKLEGPSWWVILEADYAIAREVLRSEQKSLMSIASLVVVVFAVAFGAFWALLISNHERKTARHFKHLAQEIDKQRKLLDRINNTISDYIVLKDPQGRFLYVNPAFAEAVGRQPEALIGLDNEAVFGYDTAQRLDSTDQKILTSGEPATFNELLYLQSQPHHLQISQAVLKDTEGSITGTVSVLRDVTAIVEIQKRRDQATTKTVEALVKAIELTDPYLAGHSRLMGRLSAEIAKAINASDLDVATVQTAANLSQIGKLFVDRELLFKADTLTPEEKARMAQHVEHASNILENIDFGLPIYEAIYQMNETPDGKGYPQGLLTDEISLPARILSVTNSFCAMVRPRVYRGARSVEETLEIMESEGGRYDQQLVSTLKDVLNSAIGEKLLNGRIEN